MRGGRAAVAAGKAADSAAAVWPRLAPAGRPRGRQSSGSTARRAADGRSTAGTIAGRATACL